MNQRTKNTLKVIREFTKDFLVPITVGISAVIVAIKANQISEIQTLIAKNAERPIFQIVAHTISTREQIDITVLSGIYSDYESEVITFVALDFVEYDEDGIWRNQEGAECPTVGYYSVSTRDSDLYGTIETMSTYDQSYIGGDSSYVMYQNLLDTISSHYDNQASPNSKESPTYHASIHTYIKITYTNLLDEPESVYYSLCSYGASQAIRIDSKVGEQEFVKWKNMLGDGLFVNPSLPERVLFGNLDRAKDLYSGM